MQLELLGALDWLQKLSQAKLNVLAHAITPVAIPAGGMLCRAGTHCVGLLLLRTGNATLLRPCGPPAPVNSPRKSEVSTKARAEGGGGGDAAGGAPEKGMEVVGTRAAGETVGEQCLLQRGVSPLTAVANRDIDAYFLSIMVRA